MSVHHERPPCAHTRYLYVVQPRQPQINPLAVPHDLHEPLPACRVPVVGAIGEHPFVVREPGADSADEEQQRGEAFIFVVQGTLDAALERWSVQEREVNVKVAEIEVNKRVHEIFGRELVRWRGWELEGGRNPLYLTCQNSTRSLSQTNVQVGF